MKDLTAIFLIALWPCVSLAAQEDRSFDVPKIYGDFISIQRALENRDNSVIQKVCDKNQQSMFFCAYANFLIGKSNARELIKALPAGKEGFYKFFKYDEYIGQELAKNKIPNPYGDGPAFAYINQLSLLSHSFPKDALPALLTMYRYSQGFWAEYIKSELVKLMSYERFGPEFATLEKSYQEEMKSLREAYKVEQAARRVR